MHTTKDFKSNDGFTLIEILVAVGIFAMLAGITVVGVNPARQISNTRNAQRVSAVANIQGAINHYALDGFGGYPAGIDTTLRMIGTSTTACAITCGPDTLPETPTGINSFADDTITEFDLGTHSNTQAGASGLALSAAGLTAKTGTYSSQIFDAGSSATWNGFTWLPNSPYGKELPNSQLTETGYPAGNAAMTSNVLLMHMNETSGTITDSSGNANTGTIFGTVSYNAPGLLKTSLLFSGTSNSYIRANNATNLNLPNNGGTVMLWIKPTITNTSIPQNSGMGILRKPDYNGNLAAPGGYGLEIYRNLTTNPANIKMSLGWNSGLSSSVQSLTGTTNILTGTWYHVAMNWNATTMNIYVNGVLDATATRTTGPLNWANGTEKLYIGHANASVSSGYNWYNGWMDEIAFFSRQLSPTEIASAYQRGALRPKLYARSCNDAACAGETFGGTDGTAGTYFSEENNSTLTPAATFTLLSPANRYFQYQLKLDTDTNTAGPIITRVSGGNTGATVTPPSTATTETTAGACLNLATLLVPTYITALPVDPQTGSQAKTYYAVKKIGMDGITVRSCSPELGKNIEVKQ
jgi:prepilin-type N-terminal cleavage/methylation domain-containing protein